MAHLETLAAVTNTPLHCTTTQCLEAVLADPAFADILAAPALSLDLGGAMVPRSSAIMLVSGKTVVGRTHAD